MHKGKIINSHVGPLQLASDTWFVNDIHKTVKLQAARSTAPVYYYKFSFDGELGFLKRIIGACRFPGKSDSGVANGKSPRIQTPLLI
jgi:hypothetical protein